MHYIVNEKKFMCKQSLIYCNALMNKSGSLHIPLLNFSHIKLVLYSSILYYRINDFYVIAMRCDSFCLLLITNVSKPSMAI